MSYQQDLERSENAFWTYCAEPLDKFFEARQIIPMSQKENKIAVCLDRNGVDFIINSDRYGLIPIQFKCSFGKPYRNFVIRRSRTSGAMTDFDKLTRAKRFGTIPPLFHCACFVDNDGDADIALAATDDLMKFVDNNLADIRAHENGTFLTCDWRRLEVHGVKVFRLDCRADFQKEENA